MSQQAQPVVTACQTVAFSRQCDLWDGLIPKTIVAYRVDDLRDLPLIERKQRLARLMGRAKRQAIHFNEHLTDDGPTVFKHVCRMGWKASSQREWTRRIAAGHQGRGSSRKIRQARRCGGNARSRFTGQGSCTGRPTNGGAKPMTTPRNGRPGA